MSTRVLIADDHALVRQGIRSMLSDAPDLEIVGEATDGRETVELAEKLRQEIATGIEIASGGCFRAGDLQFVEIREGAVGVAGLLAGVPVGAIAPGVQHALLGATHIVGSKDDIPEGGRAGFAVGE